jgi:DNA-binding CsgD family transcriptional regulator
MSDLNTEAGRRAESDQADILWAKAFGVPLPPVPRDETDRESQYRALVKMGFTVSQIGREIGESRWAVYKVLDQLGLTAFREKIGSGGHDPERDDQIKKLCAERKTAREIANILVIMTPGAVRKASKRLGVKPRLEADDA